VPVKYIAAAAFIWIVGALGAGIYEGITYGTNSTSTLNGILSWSRIFTEQDFGVLEIPGIIVGFFGSLFDIITLNFAFLSGDYEIVRWLILAPITALLVFGVIVTFFGIFQRVVT